MHHLLSIRLHNDLEIFKKPISILFLGEIVNKNV